MRKIKKLIVILAIIAGGWYAFFGQRLLNSDNGVALQYLKNIQKVTSEDISNILNENQSKVKLIYIYNSTGILNNIFFDEILEVVRSYQSKGAAIIVLSVDQYPLLLSSFLVDRKLSFKPWILSDNKRSLEAQLNIRRIHYQSSEPYLVVVNNKEVMEFELAPGLRGRMMKYLASLSSQ